MVLRWIVTLSLAFLGFALLKVSTGASHAQAPTIISGKFYKFDVIAASNEAPLASILAAPSINDNGVVSFIGTFTNVLITGLRTNPSFNQTSVLPSLYPMLTVRDTLPPGVVILSRRRINPLQLAAATTA